jgi:hypothetical protein
MSTQQKVHIKLKYNNQFRRFVIEPEYKFNDLKQKISTLLNISTTFGVQYLDEESEWITIDSDIELLSGIELSPSLLKLRITDSQTPVTQDPNPEPVSDPEEKKSRNENSEHPSEQNNDNCPKWKRHRKYRNENSESVQNNDCSKWKKNRNSESDLNNDNCPKWKRYRKYRNENSEQVSDPEEKKSGNENSEQPSEQNDNCPKWKRHRKYRNENSEQVSDQNNNDNSPKWKRYKKFRNERSEANGENVEMKGSRGRRGRGKWAEFTTNENSESDSIEEKNAEEIKKEIASLKEEIQLLMEKKKGQWAELAGLKEKVKNLRMNNGAKEDIVKLREEIFEKKKLAQGYQMQIGNSKNRIWKLKSALVIKAD